MNNALYEIASFMVMRESVVWRWSHNRHHSDTIIVGRDPEIAVPRPPDLADDHSCRSSQSSAYPAYFKPCVDALLVDACPPTEKTFIPEIEFHRVYRNARIYAAIYASALSRSRFTRAAFCHCCSWGCRICLAAG